MVANGTKRVCQGGDHKIVYESGALVTGWRHLTKEDWVDRPHKAAPKKHKRKVTNADNVEEREA